MLVKILMLDSGPNRNRKPGQIVEVDAARASALVEAGHATYDLDARVEETEERPAKARKGG